MGELERERPLSMVWLRAIDVDAKKEAAEGMSPWGSSWAVGPSLGRGREVWDWKVPELGWRVVRG